VTAASVLLTFILAVLIFLALLNTDIESRKIQKKITELHQFMRDWKLQFDERLPKKP
jgi:hypothetical protein